MKARHLMFYWPRQAGQACEGTPCPYCKLPMDYGTPGHHGQTPLQVDLATVQHIIPRRAGGKNFPENCRWACWSCNSVLALVEDCPGALAAIEAIRPDPARPLRKHPARMAFVLDTLAAIRIAQVVRPVPRPTLADHLVRTLEWEPPPCPAPPAGLSTPK